MPSYSQQSSSDFSSPRRRRRRTKATEHIKPIAPDHLRPAKKYTKMENIWSCECVPICTCVPTCQGFRPLKNPSDHPSSFSSFRSLLKLLHMISNRDSYALLTLGVLSCIVYSGAYNSFAELTGIFTQAVMDRNKIIFFRAILQLALASIIGAVSTTGFLYLGERLTLGVWRRQLISKISDEYYRHGVSFQLAQMDGRILDADQRIGSDITALCESLKIVLLGAPMFMGFIPVSISCLWFSVTLWIYAGSLCVFAVYIYFILFVLLERPIIGRTREISKQLDDAMGTFRFTQTYFHLHSETVALGRGHARERIRNDSLFHKVDKLSIRESRWNFAINLNANIFYWGAGAVSYIIPGFILGKVTDVDTFVAAATMISLILYQLAYLIQLSQELSKLLALSDRVLELFSVLDDIISSSPLVASTVIKEPNMQNNKASSSKIPPPSDGILFDQVTIMTPSGKILFPGGISFQVNPGGHSNLLIMGPSGVGKSSLLRCLGDLWPVHKGKILKPSHGIFHVAQRPYLMHGSLRGQLAYPSDPKLLSDSEAEYILSAVGLPSLFGDLDKECSWSQVLSLGEQQLLVIGRLLFHKPPFLVLDECTSAMDEEMEKDIYKLLIKTGAGIISIAHRSNLIPFHHKLIKIDKDGNYGTETVVNNVYNET